MSPRSRLVLTTLARSSQGGFSLIVSLMMLIVIIILGISGSQMAINEERGSRADRDRQVAFQAAEAALKDAEYELYGPTGRLCTLPGQVNRGNMRTGTNTCFNEISLINFQYGCTTLTSTGGGGLCLTPVGPICPSDPTTRTSATCPAYLLPAIDFLADAKGSGSNYTVPYGQYTGRTYPSQATAALASLPVSKYPPRYIIERVLKNTSFSSASASSASDTESNGQTYMFRVTAMGFGANPNSQVVLQAIVATQN